MSTSRTIQGRLTQLRSDDFVSVARRAATPMLITLVVTTALSVAVGLVILGPLADSVGRWDLLVVEDLVAARTSAGDRLTGVSTVLADSVPVAVLWVGAMAVGARLTGQWVVPVFLLFVIGGEKLTYLVTSLVVDRPRPPLEALGHVFATSSFPSGHVGSAVALYGSIAVAILWHRSELGRPLPTWCVVVAVVAVVAVAGLVAFSRIYRSQHYPSDVLWGAMLGVVWLVAGWRLVLGARSPEVAPARTDHHTDVNGP